MKYFHICMEIWAETRLPLKKTTLEVFYSWDILIISAVRLVKDIPFQASFLW